MQFYVHRNGQQMGPFSPDQVRSQLLSGAFQSTDLAWHEGAPGWAPLSSYPAVVGPSQSYRSSAVFSQSAGSQLPQTSGLAIASLVLGILSLFLVGITSIPAVICGHISLSQIKKAAGQISGKGLAIAGLVIGYLGILCVAALILGIALPAGAAIRDRAQATKCLSEARQIGIACKLYAMDHQGDYPPTLDQLIPDDLPDNHLFGCQLRKDEPPMGYDYFGGKDTDPATNVLLSSKATTRDHKRVVVFSDGSAELRRHN